jgi:hypothetical protein
MRAAYCELRVASRVLRAALNKLTRTAAGSPQISQHSTIDSDSDSTK